MAGVIYRAPVQFILVEGMKNEPKYRRSARRELSGAQWRRLGVLIGTLMIAVIVVVVVALLVALGEIAF